MNIYFINRNSRWKGPFDVIDAKGKRIISIGDVCLRDTNDGISFLYVERNTNKWNLCRTIGYGTNRDLLQIGNSLLFSFDGVRKRYGNIGLLQVLIGCFNENKINTFLSNAIEILEYKKDFWDFGVLLQLFCPSQNLPKQQGREKQKIKTNSSTKQILTIFVSYFDETIVDEITSLLNSGKTLREAYTLIRRDRPVVFQKTLLKFLQENPGKTIYDVCSP